VSLAKLAVQGTRIAAKAAERARDRIITRAIPPPGVEIAPAPEGIVLSGKRVRHRFVTDPYFRNLIR
jgi:hypothetical protein